MRRKTLIQTSNILERSNLSLSRIKYIQIIYMCVCVYVYYATKLKNYSDKCRMKPG